MKNPPADLADRLLQVAEQVLRADPPLRLEDVARLVDASRATLYYYFSGRDDLLTFLLTAHTRAGAEAMRDAVRTDDPPEHRLAAAVDALIEFLGRHPGTCAGLLAALGGSGRITEVLRENDTRIAGPLRELITEAAVAVPDPADAANAVVGAILLAVLGRTLAGGDPTDPAFRKALTEQTLRGVLAGVPTG